MGGVFRSLGPLACGHVVEVKREDLVGRFTQQAGRLRPVMAGTTDEELGLIAVIDIPQRFGYCGGDLTAQSSGQAPREVLIEWLKSKL